MGISFKLMNIRKQLCHRLLAAWPLGVALLTTGLPGVSAQTIDAFYSGSYSFVDLGQALGVPVSYGALTFKAGEPSTLLLGGNANEPSAVIYSVNVLRGAGNHVTGFSGTASAFASAYGGPVGEPQGGIDGGLTYGPGNVLFYTSFDDNHLGQIKPGSSSPDKLIDLTTLGISSSVGAVAFVPNTFGGGGHLKILSFDADKWYDATITPDGTGTFNVSVAGGAGLTLPASNTEDERAGPEGVIYVPAGNPGFAVNSVLIAEWGINTASTGFITSYEVDANGDPIISTRKTFMSGLQGAQGATIDPLTGDFLFSTTTFGASDRVLAVRGFTTVVPEPSSLVLLGLPLAAALVWRRKQRA